MEGLLSHKNFVALSGEVRQVVRRLSWWQRHGVELSIFILRVFLWIAGFFIFAQPGWWWKIIGMIILSYGFYGIGITGSHETAHRSFSSSLRINQLLGYFFTDFWSGLSSKVWFRTHVQTHHVVTNLKEEPQQFYYPKFPRIVYFYIAPYFAMMFWLWGHSVQSLRKSLREVMTYIIISGVGIVFHIWLFHFFVSWPLAILCVYIMRSLWGPIFLHLSLFNHLGMENPLTKPPWLPHQSATTRNLAPHWFLTGLGGNAFVDCHIEHHLFPNLSNRVLAHIRPLVRKYLLQEGYRYEEVGYWWCLRHCWENYRELFSIWQPDIV
jgi:fatty acid desaturase